MTTVLLQPWVTTVHLWLLKHTLFLVRFDPRSLPFKVTLHLCSIVMFRLGGARSALEGDCTLYECVFQLSLSSSSLSEEIKMRAHH